MGEIYQIAQDKYGFLWLFNYQMVCRFDGVNFMPYRPSQSNPAHFPPHHTGLGSDKNGNIWLTHANGISVFDYATNQFINYDLGFRQGEIALKIVFDQQNRALVGTSKGRVLLFDTQTERISKIGQIKEEEIKSIVVLSNQKIWVGGLRGIYELENKDFTAKKVIDILDNSNATQRGVTKLFQDADNDVWACIPRIGLWKINPSTKAVEKKYQPDQLNFYGYTNEITSIVQSNSNSAVFYLASSQGLVIFDKKNEKFSVQRLNSKDPNIPYWIGDVLQDNLGNIWTAGNTLNKSDGKSAFFTLLKPCYDKNNCWFDPAMYFEEIDNQRIIIATWGGGLAIYNRTTQTIEQQIKLADLLDKTPHQNQIYTIFRIDADKLLLGSNSELLFYDLKTKIAKNISKLNHINTERVFGITQDRQKRFWVAAANGIFVLNKNLEFAKKVQYFFTNKDNKLSIFCDSEGSTWVGSSGLAKYNEKANIFIENKKLRGIEVRQILESPDGMLWCATAKGLVKITKNQNNFELFDVESGFSESYVHQIQHDAKGNIWATGISGINVFNPKDNTVKSYTTRNGLTQNQLILGFCKGKSGRFYASLLGDLGIETFMPDSAITTNNANIQLRISQVKMGEKVQNFDPNAQNQITLAHDSPLLTIAFALLNFASPLDNQYYYYLEGSNSNWVALKNQNQISFSNLKSGHYVLHIKARTPDGKMNAQEATFKIDVTTPFYASWWFLILCFCLVGAVFYAFYRNKINRLLELQSLRNAISRDLHDEIGSTLSSISMLSATASLALDKDLSQSKNLIETISNNTQKMLESMDDIVWAINPREDSFENIMVRMREYVYCTMEAKNIEVKFEDDPQLTKLSLPMRERRNLYLIFKETVNNAAKHAACTRIEIIFELKANILSMTIGDNGRGFDVQKPNNRNGLRNIRQRATEIGGHLEINSSPDQGTKVFFRIKV